MDPSKTGWRELLLADENFDQNVTYDVNKIIKHLQEVEEDLEHIKPYQFLSAIYEFTKAFYLLSAALSLGFSDITEKVEIMRKLFKVYTDCDDIQSLMEKEIEMNIHTLNGSNNYYEGFDTDSEYYYYISGTRTMLRLVWFLQFLVMTFRKIVTSGDSLKTCLKTAYEEVLSPHHTWLVRQAVKVALGVTPGNKEAAIEAFFSRDNLYN